uniref:Amino acid transporter transmembrane domain-containing protein n=1 Tax=Nelumbo nucifera TaxID=4432 RepID=A0A822YUS1_NELNU|nr:TPA_asm: hypothetical protein HUJ06_008475 [Nelumbo nucifera]
MAQAERPQRERNLDNWLPITATRKAKWYYSAFHNVTAMVGAGVLGLPFAMSQLGWISGILAITVSWMTTLYSLWQLVELHEVVPGKRFDRYPQLGEHAFGVKLGYWIVMPQQLTVQIASDIVYMVTAPNFHSLRGISLLAAIMSFSYSAIAFVASTIKGTHHHPVRYGVRSHTTAGVIFDVFSGLGTIAFAFAGHSVVLEIQATIPSSPEKPSRKPMWKGVIVAYIIVALCYFSVAISGFWAFGDSVEDDVLVSLEEPRWLIAAANFMVFLHVIGSYQVFAMPVFDLIESVLIQKLKFNPGRALRLIARSTYVALTGFIGICIPFFGGLLGFFGGLVFASTSYFLPCVMWLIIKKPKSWSFHWIASWIAIIVGVLIMILAPIGGARQIALSAKQYKFFS